VDFILFNEIRMKRMNRSPKQLDADGERCLLVIENGRSTHDTFGRGSGIESFVLVDCANSVRTINEYDLQETSKEFAVYPYSPFSAPGDSGSIVTDGQGRIVGTTDVTYVTPYFWLQQRIKVFPGSHLYPMETMSGH
jgi:hypothetical protein